MQYIILEIKGYMNFMSIDAAVKKVSRNHLGKKDFLIVQALKELQK